MPNFELTVDCDKCNKKYELDDCNINFTCDECKEKNEDDIAKNIFIKLFDLIKDNASIESVIDENENCFNSQHEKEIFLKGFEKGIIDALENVAYFYEDWNRDTREFWDKIPKTIFKE